MNKNQTIETLFDSMSQLKKLLLQHSIESAEERTATLMQYSALKYLTTTAKSTVGDIARHLHLSKSSATQLVERLEKMGLLTRIHDTTDRRVVQLTITAKGQEAAANLRRKFIDKMSKLFAKIPSKDLQELIRIHTILINVLQTK